nr:putative ribonuclease H-like domain-containing protein [Tanacetum cinerariifolium]
MAIGEPSGPAVSINGLDDGNPLHVQNSDNSNSVVIPFKLFGTGNYKIWFGAVRLALQARNKMDLLMMQKLLSLINDNPSSSIHANMAGRASFFNGANQHLTVSAIGILNAVDITSLNITV